MTVNVFKLVPRFTFYYFVMQEKKQKEKCAFLQSAHNHLQSADVFIQQRIYALEWVCAGEEGLKIGRV